MHAILTKSPKTLKSRTFIALPNGVMVARAARTTG